MLRGFFCLLVILLVVGCAARNTYVDHPPKKLQDFCGHLENRSHEIRYARSTGWEYTEGNNKYLYDQYLAGVLPYTPESLVESVKRLARGEVEAPFDDRSKYLVKNRNRQGFYRRCYAFFGSHFDETLP
jgi:hypothetical protein